MRKALPIPRADEVVPIAESEWICLVCYKILPRCRTVSGVPPRCKGTTGARHAAAGMMAWGLTH